MVRVHIYDTTLRDGSQGEGVNFSLLDKLSLTRRLDDLGVDFIEGGYPLSNPKDFEYFQEAKKLSLRHARIAAFGMTRRKNVNPKDDTCIKALLDADTSLITIVGKTWDMHVREVLGTTLDENLRMIADSVAHCVEQGRDVFYDAEHFFDGFRHNPEYALRTLKAAEEAGARVVILCDTNGGTLPEDVAAGVDAARRHLRVELGIHCHNDCDVAVANTLAAVAHGATQVQGTFNGIGERCGNVDLVSVIANLALKRGHDVLVPGSLAKLTEVSRYVYETANMNFRPGQPFVGASAFAHKGGMHTHAVAKVSSSYEHVDPALVGNERRILVSELSGQSTILTKTARLKLDHDRDLMARILTQVQDLENEGYEFEAAEASFDLLVRQTAGLYRPWFERLSYRVNIEADKDGTPRTEATVKLRVDGQEKHEVSEGDGPVNALDRALRKALLPTHPRLAEMHLADYKVRVVNARAESAARVRVVIEWRDARDSSVWGTVGVSENVVEAELAGIGRRLRVQVVQGRGGRAMKPMKATERVTKPATDRWRYGERHAPRVRSDGEIYYQRLPLRKLDLLFPQEGDRPVLTDDHSRDCYYLFGVLDVQARRHRRRRVFTDHRVDFQVPGIPPLGPDVLVLDNIGEWDGALGTLPVRTMGSSPLLGMEVTSKDSRPYDLRVKPGLYSQCGVQCYAIVDRLAKRGREIRVLAYQAGPDGYLPISPNETGRVWLEPVGLWLGIEDRRATLYDRHGRRLPEPQEQVTTLEKRVKELEAELRRRQKGK